MATFVFYQQKDTTNSTLPGFIAILFFSYVPSYHEITTKQLDYELKIFYRPRDPCCHCILLHEIFATRIFRAFKSLDFAKTL